MRGVAGLGWIDRCLFFYMVGVMMRSRRLANNRSGYKLTMKLHYPRGELGAPDQVCSKSPRLFSSPRVGQ